MKVHLVLGTRPEIIKLAPLIWELQKRKIDYKVIHTGQHYSENMDQIFWRALKLQNPDYMLSVRESTHATQTAQMLRKIEEIFMSEQPDWVVVQGDTNSTLSGALAAAKFPRIQVAHVEAGLRSWDRTMPEEINRLMVDHISHLLFPPTEMAKKFLEREGLHGEHVLVTGNTIMDVLKIHLPIALQKKEVLQKIGVTEKKYCLMTIHRQENTENENRFRNLITTLFHEAKVADLSVVFPAHPRTVQRMKTWGLAIPDSVKLIEPLGYHEFLALENFAALTATDSGGVQEEACILNVPCLTLRENTERPETVELGANILAGVEPVQISNAFRKILSGRSSWQNPYGQGNAATLIVDALLKFSR